MRGNDIAMIFQDPLSSLHPFYKVGNQIVEAMQAHRSISNAAARERAAELLALVGIPDPRQRVDAYPHELSGGMRQRAMIAMALSNEPKLLIADEPTTALDVTVQAQILQLIARLQRELGMAVVLITHDLGVVAEVTDRHRRDVRGQDRRGRRDRQDLPRSRAPLHLGPAAVDPAAGPPARRAADPDRRPATEPDQPPQRLLLPPAVSVRARPASPRRAQAGAAARRSRASGRMPAREPGAQADLGATCGPGKDPQQARAAAHLEEEPA